MGGNINNMQRMGDLWNIMDSMGLVDLKMHGAKYT